MRDEEQEPAAPVEPDPVPEGRPADYWTEKGFTPFLSARLERAGIDTVEALSRLTREEFLALHDLGGAALAKCEALLGQPLPAAGWIARGCSPDLTSRLVRAGIRTLEDLKRRTPEELRALGLSRRDLAACKRITDPDSCEAQGGPQANERSG